MLKRAESKYLFLALGFSLLVFSVFRINLAFPITLNEAKESYTAYSLIRIGRDTNGERPNLFFRADNNYLSTLGVYLRIPSVSFFGLTNIGVRLPGLLIGLAALFVFYKVAKLLLPRRTALVATFIMMISPYVIQINIFNLDFTLAILCLLSAFYFFKEKRTYLFLLFELLSILAAFSTIPFLLVLTVGYFYSSHGKKTALASAVVMLGIFIILLKSYSQLGNFLIRQSFIKDILPSNYTFQIDKRLSFGQIANSPLITPRFNYNRLVFNKVFFGANEFFKSLVKPFNYELLTSSFQSQTILAKETLDSVVLPKIFFWEIPIIFGGLIIFSKAKTKDFTVFTAASLASVFVFGLNGLYLLIPIIAVLEATFLIYLFESQRSVPPKILLSALLLLALFSYLDFLGRMWFQKLTWAKANDLAQYYIWNTVNKKVLEGSTVIVTDRLGEPAFYYLFYERIAPSYFQKFKGLGTVAIGGVNRIEKIGSVEFRSFKYWESPRGTNEFWVGMAGEFVGENRDFRNIAKVTDGEIAKRISGIKQDNKFLGDELWFVKTTLK